MPSLYARHQMAEQLKLCVKGLNPVLFNTRQFTVSDKAWLENHAAISGDYSTNANRVDGVKFLADILRDGKRNFNENKLVLPKQAVIQDQGKYVTKT